MPISKQVLTRRDWDKRFVTWSVLLAGIASGGSLTYGYHSLWFAFAFVVPLYLLMRYSTPVNGYHSPLISRWSILVIPTLFVFLPMAVALTRYVLNDLLP
ncbi:hypothetical protein CA13_11020 [Planctomycetes bacterium CA13]|uniref:Uncharacterized protein n=1 Tax=Novipirellula herctigrandis TaxID=2527986 RepID=A0A5C5YYE0_9BACT|nr:hypothetical protein CA13_11020 [Planctomycetes bacterium CA13]